MNFSIRIMVFIVVLISCAIAQSVTASPKVEQGNPSSTAVTSNPERCVHMTWTGLPSRSVVAYRENGNVFIKEVVTAPDNQPGQERISADSEQSLSRDCDGGPTCMQTEKFALDICPAPGIKVKVPVGGTLRENG